MVIAADVRSPVFLLQGVYSNRRGQPTVVEWMAVDRLPDHPHVRPLQAALEEAGVGPRLGNTGRAPDLAMLQQLVVHAVRAGREHMRAVRDDRDAALTERVQRHERRLRSWQRHAEQLTLEMAAMPQRRHREKEVAAVAADTEGLIADQRTSGDPLVRVVAVLVGER